MKKLNYLMFAAAIVLQSFVFGFAQTGEFDSPWRDERIAIVIDPFQGNEIVWNKVAQDTRVVGVVHRATFGDRRDTKYAARKTEALQRGYKWGKAVALLAGTETHARAVSLRGDLGHEHVNAEIHPETVEGLLYCRHDARLPGSRSAVQDDDLSRFSGMDHVAKTTGARTPDAGSPNPR